MAETQRSFTENLKKPAIIKHPQNDALAEDLVKTDLPSHFVSPRNDDEINYNLDSHAISNIADAKNKIIEELIDNGFK